MESNQIHLLNALGSGVRPVDLGEVTPAAQDRFQGLLREAISGHARTELGVTFAPSAAGMFDQTQQEHIARAVDLAAAAGSQHALILHDEHSLRVDVRNRVVTEAPRLSDTKVIQGIDAFVAAQSPVSSDPETVKTPMISGGFHPARGVRNASLVRTIALQESAQETT
jgi:hypothetical protein